LFLAPATEDTDWNELAGLARIADNPNQRLLQRPVKMTKEGFEIK